MTDIPNENPDKIGSRFAMVMAVAKRAKQIREGSPKLVECRSKNPITVAMEEIAAGMVTMRIPTQEEIEIAERKDTIPKAATAAREAAELLRVTDSEEEIEEEALIESVSADEAEISATVVDVDQAEPSVEESEEVEKDQKPDASTAETDELESADEEVEEEETPADENEE